MNNKLPPLIPTAFQPPKDTNLKGSPSSRRASQYREISVSNPSPSNSGASSQAHFLDGFNVDACFDVRSIPDPPSPSPVVRRRRLSSPSLPRSFGDVTNHAQAGSGTKSSKRSRKSLCHIPSPLDGRSSRDRGIEERSSFEHRDEIDDSNRREDMVPDPTTQPNLQLCIELDDTDERGSSRNKRRKKKRQSMAIPRDLINEQNSSMPLDETSKEPSLDEASKPAMVPSPIMAFKGTMQDMRELQTLVRGYCDLPLGQRNFSIQAKTIQDSTGYPLISPPVDFDEGNPVGSVNQRVVLQRLAPLIDQMDQRKARETAYWQAETQCRVEKTSSGKYRYYSLDNNGRVSSKEYGRRYLASVERNSVSRLEFARQWKVDFQPNVEHNSSAMATNDESFSGIMGPCVASSDSSTVQELDLDLPSILAVKKEPIEDDKSKIENSADEGDIMEICDTSVSLDFGDQSFTSLPASAEADKKEVIPDQMSMMDGPDKEAQIVMPAREVSTEFCSESTTSPPTSSDFAGKDAEKDIALVKTVSEEESENEAASLEDLEVSQQQSLGSHNSRRQCEAITDQGILPFPDRDESSSDPEIAMAERKLWDRIDVALKDYSREVILIMQKKRQPNANAESCENVKLNN